MTTPNERVRKLDERLVPVAAERARRLVDATGAVRGRVLSSYRALDPQLLDERYASTGPLAKVRDVPLLGVLVVLALLVAGTGLAAKRESDRAREVRDGLPEVQVAGTAGLGPVVGESVARYLDDSVTSLTRAVQTAPDASRVALVSFAGYRTPTQTRAVVSGFRTVRLYVRARAAGELATPLPVEVKGDLAAQLPKAFGELARAKLAAEKAYQGYVDTLKAASGRDQQFKALYEAFARSSGIEAREFGRGCACVYAAVVTATPAQLLSLRARQGVRAVEVAPAGASLSGIQVQPLLPEVTTVVPKPSYGVKR
jgi:hypothetical protein